MRPPGWVGLQRRFAAFTDGLGTGRRLERLSTVWTLLRIDVHDHPFGQVLVGV